MREGNSPKPRAQPAPRQNPWIVAAGGVALVVVAFAWVTLSNLTWPLFFPLLALGFVFLFWLMRRYFAREPRANATPAVQALAALVAAAPFALALVAPADLLNRLSLAQATPLTARVMNVEHKEDGYGRGTRAASTVRQRAGAIAHRNHDRNDRRVLDLCRDGVPAKRQRVDDVRRTRDTFVGHEDTAHVVIVEAISCRTRTRAQHPRAITTLRRRRVLQSSVNAPAIATLRRWRAVRPPR